MGRKIDPCSISLGIAEQIRKDLRIGQKVKTNKVPWSSGQGKSDYEHRPRVGKVIAKYPHFFVVQFPCYRECFKYTDIVSDTVQLYDEAKEDQDAFSWLRSLKGW